MRSNLLGVCSVVATVAVAGSANAGIVDTFQVTETNGPLTWAGVGAANQVGASLDPTTCLFGSRTNMVLNKGTSTNSGNGTMAVTLGQASLTLSGSGERRGKVVLDYQYGGQDGEEQWHDLTGVSSFSIGVSNYSGGETSWTLKAWCTAAVNPSAPVVSMTASSSAITNGILTFSVDAATTPAGFEWVIDRLELTMMRSSLGTVGSTVSFTLSNFEYTVVPAPGAITLLGAAGLIGSRRRKA